MSSNNHINIITLSLYKEAITKLSMRDPLPKEKVDNETK